MENKVEVINFQELKLPDFKSEEELKEFLVKLLKQVNYDVYNDIIGDVLDEVDSQRNYCDSIFRTCSKSI